MSKKRGKKSIQPCQNLSELFAFALPSSVSFRLCRHATFGLSCKKCVSSPSQDLLAWLLAIDLLARFISSIASIAKIIQEELCELKSSEGDKL